MKRMRTPRPIALSIAVSVLLLALAPPSSAGAAAPEHAFHHYVFDTMKFGTSAGEASSYGFDLDNDARHVPENTLGQVLASLSNVIHLDSAIAAAIHAGEVVTLGSLRSDSLRTDQFASWQVYSGVPQPNPVLTGGGQFTIDPNAAAGTELLGAVDGGQFNGGPGTVPIRLGLVSGQAPIEFHIVGARIQARCATDGCSDGKLGGGVTATEVDTVIIPALAAVFQAIVDASCPGLIPASCSPTAQLLLSLFDINHDGTITATEVRANALIQAILAPDEDLLQADGTPGHDGVKESLSLGIGFTTKTATFDVAGESYPRPSAFPPRPAPFTATMREVLDTLGGVSGTGTVTALGRVEEHSIEAGPIAPCSGSTGWDFNFFPPTITLYSEVAMDTARGDRICIAITLTLTDTATPPEGINFSLSGGFAIRGGTNQFAAATGGGTIVGTCTSPVGSPLVRCQESWSGVISAP